MLGKTELVLSHGLDHLIGLLREALSHALRFFRIESLQLIEERHLLDLFLGVLFNLAFFSRDLRFVNFGFAFCGEIRARAHRKRGSQHASEARDENVMLLIVRRAGHA